ncbi:hypothetical protein KKA00_12310 [bacterium]|nr:hypothetical protein [bacterium]MBU1652999.1 hypothetical protein [bacterium]MBU1882430.1 hypothetical protein [bacterium]
MSLKPPLPWIYLAASAVASAAVAAYLAAIIDKGFSWNLFLSLVIWMGTIPLWLWCYFLAKKAHRSDEDEGDS